MQTATTDSLVGRKLEARYRILDRIARGGMSTVYAAIDERLDRLVAVKVMNAALSADPAFSDRFAREARAAARLTHLNAVSVYDQGHEVAADGHHVFLVMELVEGRTLRELIHERGKLSPAEAVSIMEPVLSALSAAHRAGLVHRDVKPENILLSDDGVVKVADFGLARAVEADASSTRTGLMMGTVAYCSPEQISRGNSDPRSDVYSAGVVFFELLTGQPPFRGDSAMNVAYQHVHSRVPAPSSRVRSIPSEIDEIVVAATDSDPAGRPADAGALLAELADVRAQLGLEVMPVPPRHRVRRARHDEQGPDERRQSGRARRREERHDTPQRATTDLLREPARRHDTSVALVSAHPTTAYDGTHGASRYEPPAPVVTPPPRRRSRARRRRRSFLVLLIIIALGVGSFFGAKAFIAWRFAHVPKLFSLSVPAAEQRLADAGYQVRVNPGQVYDEHVDKNHVVHTDPGSGTRFTRGRTVTLTLSAGPVYYAIPSVARLKVHDAVDTLRGIGDVQVLPQPLRRSSDTVDAGLVIGTQPGAGARVRKHTQITIVVSTGPPRVAVPAIPPDTSVADARTLLRRSPGRFRLATTDVYDDTVAKGDIVSCAQTGTARKFSTIDCEASKGPQYVVMPRIPLATDAATAVQQLRNLGLVVRTEQIGAPRDGAVVFSQRPAAGTLVQVGSTVVLRTV